jgi:formylglycine-generating enzyme
MSKYPTHTILLLTALISIRLTSPASALVDIDFVLIGNPGNPEGPPIPDRARISLGYVGSAFYISRNETTIAQYAEFLNLKAKSDPNGLYNPEMASDPSIAGIIRSGTSGNYIYTVIPGSGNRPITYVNWLDAARFCNWLHNGQGNGNTEAGAYDLSDSTQALPLGTFGFPNNTIYSTSNYWIPTENEWVKAAYYDPTKNTGTGGYWTYPTRSDTVPNATIGVPNSANYKRNGIYLLTGGTTYPTVNALTNVGAFGIGSVSYYGTNDQGGNVYEIVNDFTSFGGGSPRTNLIRGGGFATDLFLTDLTYGSRGNPLSGESSVLGFRIATNGSGMISAEIGQQALNLDGTNFAYATPPVALFPALASGFVGEAWINPSVGGFNTIASIGAGSDPNSITDFIVSTTPTNQLAFFYNGAWLYSAVNSVSTNSWSHVAVEYFPSGSGGIKQLWINGLPAGKQTSTTSPVIPSFVDFLWIGRQGSAANTNYFRGQIDDFRVWTRAAWRQLAQDQSRFRSYQTAPGLLLNYKFDEKSGKGLADSSGNGSLALLSQEIVNQHPLSTTPVDRSLALEGFTHSRSTKPAIGPTGFVLESWVKPAASGFLSVASIGEGNNPTSTKDLIVATTPTNQLAFFYNGAWQYSAENTVLPGIWTHIAVEYFPSGSGGTKQLWINGIRSGAPETSTTPPLPFDVSALFYIGRQGSVCDCNYFHGELDELRVWNQADWSRQSHERMIYRRFNTGVTGLLANYHFDEANLTPSLLDSSGNSLNAATFSNLNIPIPVIHPPTETPLDTTFIQTTQSGPLVGNLYNLRFLTNWPAIKVYSSTDFVNWSFSSAATLNTSTSSFSQELDAPATGPRCFYRAAIEE